MENKKIENKLALFAREFSFMLPDGSFPEPEFFTQLAATPLRSHLWEMILDKLQSKTKVKKIKRQILCGISKTEETKVNYVAHRSGFGIETKLDLWLKIKELEHKISARKKKIDDLRANIYKKAQAIQNEGDKYKKKLQFTSCKVAEIEKRNADLKEKLLLSNLLLDKQKKAIEEYKKQIKEIKSFGMLNSLDYESINKSDGLEKLEEVENSIKNYLQKGSFKLDTNSVDPVMNELIANKNVGKLIWELLLEKKSSNLRRHKELLDKVEVEENISNAELNVTPENVSLRTFEEEIMLKIAENSLQAVQNMLCKRSEECRLNGVVADIEKFMFNKSVCNGPSFLNESEKGDSITGRHENMSTFKKALELYGVKKRLEFLNMEVESIAAENVKNAHWIARKTNFEKEMKISSKQLVSLRDEGQIVLSVQKSSAQAVLKKHGELISSVNSIIKEFKEKNFLEKLSNFTKELSKMTDKKLTVVEEIALDAFRKTSGKEGTNDWESLPHCMQNYGGEFKEFFCSALLSPYDKPESILEALKVKKDFSLYIHDILSKNEEYLGNVHHLIDDKASSPDMKSLDKNHKMTSRALEKILIGEQKLSAYEGAVKNILKNWLEQPYRRMIPDDYKVKGMTIRQLEDRYQAAKKEIKYSKGINKAVI